MAEINHRAWLQNGLRKPGKSQSGLARFLGVSHPKVNRWVNGRTRLRADDLERIAQYIEEPIPGARPVDDVLHVLETFRDGRSVDVAGFIQVPVEGYAVEGAWMEVPMNVHSTVAIHPHPDFPAEAHYAVETGPSPNDDPDIGRKIVKCIRIEFLDRKLRHRDRVHLERVIDGKKHSTFARLIRSRDGKALVREGDDATPVDLTAVKGVVLGVDITYRL